jgi:hypothetical protein
MSIEIVDWLNASVVVVGSGLLATEEEIRSFAAKTSEEVHYGSLQIANGTEVTARLEIRKEQITVDRNPERVSVVKEYPDGSWERLAEIVTFSLQSSNNLDLTARGYNVSLVFDPNQNATAEEYIVSEIFAVLAIPNWKFSGGQATLRFQDANLQGVWTVKIAPRVGRNARRVFLDLNLHLPGTIEIGEVSGYIESARDGALSFLETLK